MEILAFTPCDFACATKSGRMVRSVALRPRTEGSAVVVLEIVMGA